MPTVNIGHRGHAGSTENTLAAFHEAAAMGADMVEFDVQLSSDGIPVLFHDYTLKRLTGRKGSIRKRTAKYLTNLELPKSLRIPTLRDVLVTVAPQIPLNIELKYNRPHYRPLVEAVCGLVKNLNLERRVIISSFLHESIRLINRYYPEIATAPLYLTAWNGDPHIDDLRLLSHRRGWKNELPFERPGLVLYHKMIDEELAQRLHDLKLTIMTYTVDEPEEMQRLIDLGVEGLITNRPDLLAKLA